MIRGNPWGPTSLLSLYAYYGLIDFSTQMKETHILFSFQFFTQGTMIVNTVEKYFLAGIMEKET